MLSVRAGEGDAEAAGRKLETGPVPGNDEQLRDERAAAAGRTLHEFVLSAAVPGQSAPAESVLTALGWLLADVDFLMAWVRFIGPEARAGRLEIFHGTPEEELPDVA